MPFNGSSRGAYANIFVRGTAATIRVPDSAVSDKYEEKKKLQSLHNPSKLFTALKSNDKAEKEWEKSWKKEDNSLTTSKSTLSLRIAAYEKSSGVEASNLFDDKNNEDLNREISGSNKNVTTASTFNVQVTFKMQQNDKASEPELSQFRTSQRLLNPNEVSNNGGQNHQQQNAAHLLHQRAIAAQHLPQQPPLQYLPTMRSYPLQQESNTAMFPKKNRSFRTSEEYKDRPNTSRDFGGRRNDWNRQNDYRRNDRRDDRRSSYNDRDRYRRTSPLPSGRGYGFETRCENSYEQNREKKRRLDAEEENAILRKRLEDSERQKKLEEEALSQRFCPHGDSDSSGDGGGAPVRSFIKL
uniref:Uncharacterized protein n=1 Tax=Panagrolaimus davidi TaxID=227884 RepID=A0A914QAK5_9BILA